MILSNIILLDKILFFLNTFYVNLANLKSRVYLVGIGGARTLIVLPPIVGGPVNGGLGIITVGLITGVGFITGFGFITDFGFIFFS